ncbi:peptidylprolyl isomerase [Puniceicoccaceae bacterium K14]|nr:peptidylprolyl isomerase [Puniceicoccaceae bacterium K14]
MSRQVVSFLYTLKNKEGEVLDQSNPDSPITYLEGGGMIIEGLEAALAKMEVGEQGKVEVRPEHGYGFRDESQIDVVSREKLPVDEVNVGDYFQTGPDQSAAIVRVIKVEGDDITLDANHPLAGVDLFFDAQVVEKRDATEEELSHGHPHTEASGCCGGGGNSGGCGCA